MSRALTLWPEWAWAIHNLDKRVENRDWMIPTGEWFALHAGKHVGGRPGKVAASDGLYGLKIMARAAGWDVAHSPVGRLGFAKPAHLCNALVAPDHIADATTIQTSAILGLFRVTRHDAPHTGDLGGWRVPDAVGNVLDYRPLTSPVPCKGAQGLWTVPPDVAAMVRERVERREWASGEVKS